MHEDDLIEDLQRFVKEHFKDEPEWWHAPSEELPPWNKGLKTGPLPKETRDKMSKAKLGKKRGSYKTSKKWDPDTYNERCESMRKSWTPERRAALAERNRMRKK